MNSTFPIVAGTGDEERRDLRVIATSLLLVLGIGSMMALALRMTPSGVWTSLLGSGFQIAGKYDLSYLASLYAVKTVIYSISAVIITFEMSYKIANASWIQLLFSGLSIAGIYQFHSSLRQVILVQLALLSVFLILVAIAFLIDFLAMSKDLLVRRDYRPISLLRPVSEDEVIAEFLKSEWNHCEFRGDQDALRKIISKPELDDAAENAKRRAVLLARHRALWEELPAGIEWHEVKVNEQALDLVRVFPELTGESWRKETFQLPGRGGLACGPASTRPTTSYRRSPPLAANFQKRPRIVARSYCWA